jgi:hypothetical protein
VAASKLGNPAKPRWCYTNELFDGSFALNNNVAPNTNPTEFAILTNFQQQGVVMAYVDEFGQVACEAY